MSWDGDWGFGHRDNCCNYRKNIGQISDYIPRTEKFC